MNKLILLTVLMFTGCSALLPQRPVVTRKPVPYAQRRPELMQACMERFLAHGVPFNDIVLACDERVYKNNHGGK